MRGSGGADGRRKDGGGGGGGRKRRGKRERRWLRRRRSWRGSRRGCGGGYEPGSGNESDVGRGRGGRRRDDGFSIFVLQNLSSYSVEVSL